MNIQRTAEILYRVGHLTFGIWIGYKKKNLWIFFQTYGFIRKIRKPSDLQIIGWTENALDGHEASVPRLFELCRPLYRGLNGKFSSKKCEECSVPENDDELMLMDVQAHSGKQQQCFQLSTLDENVNGSFCPITIQFHELASQIDPQTAMRTLLFAKFFS